MSTTHAVVRNDSLRPHTFLQRLEIFGVENEAQNLPVRCSKTAARTHSPVAAQSDGGCSRPSGRYTYTTQAGPDDIHKRDWVGVSLYINF